tara:strand:- start:171 stop:506 length:336 start_codon:yes stop_codon:yes gene_type:complete
MVLGIQIIALLFGMFMMYYSFIRYKKREFTINEFFVWAVVWLMFMIGSLVPNALDPFFKKLNFARILDVYIVAGFLFLIGVSFYNYTLARKSQKRIERIVRRIAFDKQNDK